MSFAAARSLIVLYVLVVAIQGCAASSVARSHRASDGSEITAFVGVHVVAVGAGVIFRDQTVLVEGGRILRRDASGAVIVPAGARRIDEAAGRFLIPGLADMH